MTVKELMEKLAQFDPNIDVCLEDWDEHIARPTVVRGVVLRKDQMYTVGPMVYDEGTFVSLDTFEE